MKDKTDNLTEINWMLMPIIFITLFLIGVAQSGRPHRLTQPQPAESVSSPETVPNEETTGPKFPADINADKYKFVFGKDYEGKVRITAEQQDEVDRWRFSGRDNFIKQLNETGTKGYKLESALNGRYAIVKLDETQFQYEWFETQSNLFFAKKELEKKLHAMSEKGFRLVQTSLLSRYMWIDPEIPYIINEQISDVYLLEKEKEAKKPKEQILIGTFPGWSVKADVELEKQLNANLKKGFYPVNIISQFEILLEKTDDHKIEKPEIRVIIGDIENKSKVLAKQGYRMAITNNGIAIMYQNSETVQNLVSYIWVKANLKHFERELVRLGAKGAIYKTTYPDKHGNKKMLIFEQKVKDEGKDSKFQVLTFEVDSREKSDEKKVYNELSNASKETEKTMNKFVKAGYEVRDLFDTGGEKAKKRLTKLVKEGVENRDLFFTENVSILLELRE